MERKPSDALSKRTFTLRNALIGAAAVVLVSAGGYSAYAIAQTADQSPAAAVSESPTPNIEPTASFSIISVDGRTVSVDGANSIDPDGYLAAYEWDFGDGTASGASASHKYSEYDTFTITLTVTDNDGAESSYSAEVTLDAPPPKPDPAPPAQGGYTYGNYPPGAAMPNIPGTDQPDTGACASSTGTADANGNPVCA